MFPDFRSVMMARLGINKKGPQFMDQGPIDDMSFNGPVVGPAFKTPGAFIPEPTPMGGDIMEGRTPKPRGTGKNPGYRY